LHSRNIVHGDLRGVSQFRVVSIGNLQAYFKANVLISKDGTARLSDFGLSKFMENVRSDSDLLDGSLMMSVVWKEDDLLIQR
jgi:serine/threonine protein kinase